MDLIKYINLNYPKDFNFNTRFISSRFIVIFNLIPIKQYLFHTIILKVKNL